MITDIRTGREHTRVSTATAVELIMLADIELLSSGTIGKSIVVMHDD